MARKVGEAAGAFGLALLLVSQCKTYAHRLATSLQDYRMRKGRRVLEYFLIPRDAPADAVNSQQNVDLLASHPTRGLDRGNWGWGPSLSWPKEGSLTAKDARSWSAQAWSLFPCKARTCISFARSMHTASVQQLFVPRSCAGREGALRGKEQRIAHSRTRLHTC